MSKYYKDIHSYVKAIRNTEKNVPKFLADTLGRAADKLVRETKSRTPVDSGTLQKSWKRSEVQRNGNEYKVTITNDAQNKDYGTEYATFVEYGHNSTAGNWVPGAFMLTQSQPNATKYLEDQLARGGADVFSEIN